MTGRTGSAPTPNITHQQGYLLPSSPLCFWLWWAYYTALTMIYKT